MRFALEWLGDDTTDLVSAQDALGAACDLRVALHDVGSRHEADVRLYRARLARELHRAEERAQATFQRARPHLEELASCNSS